MLSKKRITVILFALVVCATWTTAAFQTVDPPRVRQVPGAVLPNTGLKPLP